MPKLHRTTLDLPRCPHCGVDTPHLQFHQPYQLGDYKGGTRYWCSYSCRRCAGLVIAEGTIWDQDVLRVFPNSSMEVSDDIPDRARTYLVQAMDSIKSPSGAVMLAASAVDAMLKSKNLKAGSLYERINQAVAQHLITPEMAQWAHDVRLDANDQRHADESMPIPGPADATRCIEFAMALAQVMFVLPSRVQRGIQSAQQPKAP